MSEKFTHHRSPEIADANIELEARHEDTQYELKKLREMLGSLVGEVERLTARSKRASKSELSLEEVRRAGERSFENIAHNAQVGEKGRQESVQEAHIDHLTQLFNRRGFESRLDAHFSLMMRFAREGKAAPFAVALIDLDHFKSLNDTRGHAAGDAYLTAVADVVRAHVRRESDIAARIGGDEFALVLADTEERVAADTLQKILNGVRHLSRRVLGETSSGEKQPEQITASIGYVMFDPEHQRSAAEMLQEADQAMYAAKSKGKDTVSSIAEVERKNSHS